MVKHDWVILNIAVSSIVSEWMGHKPGPSNSLHLSDNTALQQLFKSNLMLHFSFQPVFCQNRMRVTLKRAERANQLLSFDLIGHFQKYFQRKHKAFLALQLCPTYSLNKNHHFSIH